MKSTDIYSQGAKANHSGSMSEGSINDRLTAIGCSPQKREYPSSWSNRSVVDCELLSLGIVAEYKNQNVSGSADQKGGTELFNAGQTLKCNHYIIVYSGSHWETARGRDMIAMYKKMATCMMRHPETFCVAAKKVSVMRENEFVDFIRGQQQKIRLAAS